MEIEKIESKINNLPPKIQKQAIDFIDFLSNKYGPRGKEYKLKFDWEGSLSDLGKKYTSVDLQHKASEWR
jgi:Protein of unknown function (DUF2281)